MKKSRKLYVLLLLLVIAALTVMPAYADVIVEPNDAFFYKHRDECERVERRFTVNSERGFVYQMKDPESKISIGAFSNGDELYISYIYTAPNGERWGIRNLDGGWVKMDELSLVYDYISFNEEFENEFGTFEGGKFNITATADDPVLVWSYPGGNLLSHKLSDADFLEAISKTYTDENGNVWGFIGYYRGHFNAWICLSDAHDDSVGGYSVEKNKVILVADAVAKDEIPPYEGNKSVLITVCALVSAVAVATGVVIFVIYGKKKSS